MILSDYLLQKSMIKKIVEADGVTVTKTTDNFNIMLVATDFLNSKKSLFVVLPNLFLAQKYYDELINVLHEDSVLFYPADELITAEMLVASGDFKFERINTITSILKGGKKIIVTHLNGAIKYQFSPQRWKESTLTININSTIEIDELTRKLLALGYEMVYTTTKTGQFSRRGSIVDIFPLNYEDPVRLDFFGDEVDTMKIFDIDTQISTGKTDRVEVLPVTEMIYYDCEIEALTKNFNDFMSEKTFSDLEKEKFNNDFIQLTQRNNLDMLSRYLGLFDVDKATIFDFLPDSNIYLVDYPKMQVAYEGIIRDLEEYCCGIGGYNLLRLDYFLPLVKLLNLPSVKQIEGVQNIKAKNSIEAFAGEVIDYHSDEKMIISDLKRFYQDKIVICFIKNPTRLDKFKDTCLNNGIFYNLISKGNAIIENRVNIITDEYSPSFELLEEKILVLNEKNIFEISHEQRKIIYKSIYSNSTKISKYDELEIGDYVVHYDYGIGRYLGIKTMEQQGVKRDYIHVSYAKGDALYIPIEQINLIQKYGAAVDNPPNLTTLGGGEWARAKQRVKKKVHDISEKLIKLYAQREVAIGFNFPSDTTEQILFEADFPYELTKDQEKAIDDIKKDMESSKPMDRLVCGDVGYGKTEVALRAAFKAVMSGKQVAVLAPTTILSRQHYYTFKNRMDKFGIEVELLNRFVSSKRQAEILKKLATGQVDVLIGTHKILSNDIRYKDLGLLIVDEEQRFGVTHKEKIKEIKISVDTITLSATPIPRTLQMSIVGIKDLSMIETPPKNRYPVQTYVLERNDTVIKEAIERELARGGQVFYMYNFVDNIEHVAAKIHNLVPEARICVGHGRLTKDQLERVLCDFIDKEYDVLVCTTIIETGVDMPDTNTLIVHDADRLGLSQMYQIRGRVGRSNRIAYAYLMYEPKKKLTEQAEKRLTAIKEFNELGSGFKIAMRDLAIRGSGDLLGEEQSGFIDSVGLEMYMKILEDEIKERRGLKIIEPIEEPKDVSLHEVFASRHIDNKYINNEDVKIEIHKKIDYLNTLEDLTKLQAELHDRFGDYDQSLELYMYEKLFKNLCKALDITKIDKNRNNFVVLYVSEKFSNNMDGNYLFELANKTDGEIKLNYFKKQILIMIDKKNYQNNDWLIPLCNFLALIKI